LQTTKEQRQQWQIGHHDVGLAFQTVVQKIRGWNAIKVIWCTVYPDWLQLRAWSATCPKESLTAVEQLSLIYFKDEPQMVLLTPGNIMTATPSTVCSQIKTPPWQNQLPSTSSTAVLIAIC